MAFSAFFSGMEIAFVSSNRMLAEVNREQDSFIDNIVEKFYKHPNTFVSTMLVGNNIALVVYGILFAKLFDTTVFAALPEAARVLCDTLLSTLIVLFTGEFMPKILFEANANRLLRFFALPAYLCYLILYPLSHLCTLISKFILYIVGVKEDDDNAKNEFTRVDLDYLVQQSIDNADNESDITEEVKIFQNALDFGSTKVKDCIIPRTEIKAVSSECSAEQLRQIFIESGHSKIIVFDDDIDNIVGYIHSSELFHGSAEEWKKNIRQLPFVPETMAAKKLLHILLQQKKSLAVVVDEFGGTCGIVSLEDIVEEIFGDIEDEHDSINYVCKQLKDGDYLISARLEIDKVNDTLHLSLPESDDYMTVGGLILNRYQSFPKLNQLILVDDKYEFKVIKGTKTKIELVKLHILEQ